MRAIPLLLIGCLVATLAACTGAGTPVTGDSLANVSGVWRATLAVGRQHTYTGTLTVTQEGGAFTAVLALTTPATVDGNLRGGEADGTLTLTGPYTVGNGCTGMMTIAVRGTGNRRAGPAELVDGCVGTLGATATLSR